MKCKCGCGKSIIYKPYHKYVSVQFISGHNTRTHNKEICNCISCKTSRGEHIPWNKGLTKETDERVKRNIEKLLKSRVYVSGFNNPLYGRKMYKLMGKNNGNYKDGSSIGKRRYPREFSRGLKNEVRKRDKYICQLCNITEFEFKNKIGDNLSVHHIDYNKKNNNINNLITLCQPCNKKVENNKTYYIEYFKERIKSDISLF